MNNEDIARVFARIDILREEGKLPKITQEDMDNEPTALAFTPNDGLYFSDTVSVVSYEPTYSESEVMELIRKALTHNDHYLCGSLVTRDYAIREANFSVWFEENKKK